MDDVIVKAAQTDEEVRQANELMAKAHFSDYWEGAEWVNTVGMTYPGFRREHIRIALHRGQVAAALRMTTDTIRVGEARLKTAGFGCVTTDKAYRRRGLTSLVMDDAMRHLRDHRFHTAMLFGIPDFYHRWGFATALAEYSTVISLRDAAPEAAPACRVRKIKPGDIPAVQRMHAANDEETACSLVRSAAHISNQWTRWENARVLIDEKGKVTAYLRGRPDGADYVVDEAGVAGYDACPALIRAAARLARAECAGRVKFLAPPSHPVIRHLMAFRADHAMRTDRNANGMLAVVDAGEMLESLAPEWERLLGGAPDRDAEVTLVVDRAPWRVRARRGAVDVSAASGRNKVSLNGRELAQLVAGFRHPEEILHDRLPFSRGDGAAFLKTLFPKRVPFVWAADRF